MMEKLNLFCLTGLITLDGPVLKEKWSFKILRLSFSSKLDWSSYIVFAAKTAPKRIGAFIRSIKCLSPEVSLGLCKSTIRLCLKYCCHIWAVSPSYILDMSDKLQKRIRTVIVSVSLGTDPPSKSQPSNFFGPPRHWKTYQVTPGKEKAQIIPTCYTCLTTTFILVSEQPTNTSWLLVMLFEWFDRIKISQN